MARPWIRRWRLAATGALVAGLVVVAGSTPALAAVTDVFELDGNVLDDASPQPDWQNFFTTGSSTVPPAPLASLPANFAGAGFSRDFVPGASSDTTTYTQGSKDTNNISSNWVCASSSNVTDKGDIQNAYSTAYRDPVTAHLIIFFGVEKNAPNGDNNMGMWFLKDGSVACNNTGGGSTPFTGNHQDGDVLLVAAFANQPGVGITPSIQAFRWNGGAGGSLGTTPLGTGGKCGTAGSENLCAITNDTSSITTPWLTQNKASANPQNKTGLGTTLSADQFYEGGADLTALGIESCFARFLANTRSSTSLTATLYDFASGSIPTCGSLTVNKYIDVDLSGTLNAGDITSGSPVTNWSFTVVRNSDSTTVCTGVTDSTGALVCSTGSLQNLTPGAYTVTETQKTGFFNSDPGPIPNTGATVSKTVTATVTGGHVDFGNTCFVDKTFRITNVPTGAGAPTSITVSYSVSGGAAQTVALAPTADATVWQGDVPGLLQTNSVTWSWSINGDSAHSLPGGSDVSLASGAFPVCAVTNSATFPRMSITGTKYKDINANGTRDAGENGIGSFRFTLSGPVTGSTTSASGGSYSFSNLVPGTYTVHEVGETGWLQTEPANNGDRTVTIHLDDTSVTVAAFGNTPLSDISAAFAALAKNPPGSSTDATNATITCVDSHGNVVASGTSSASGHNLLIGTYTCTITITDP